jgi:hypothetical protein
MGQSISDDVNRFECLPFLCCKKATDLFQATSTPGIAHQNNNRLPAKWIALRLAAIILNLQDFPAAACRQQEY